MADDDVKPTTSPEPAEDKPRSVVALPTQRELELELRLKERDEHLNRLVVSMLCGRCIREAIDR